MESSNQISRATGEIYVPRHLVCYEGNGLTFGFA